MTPVAAIPGFTLGALAGSLSLTGASPALKVETVRLTQTPVRKVDPGLFKLATRALASFFVSCVGVPAKCTITFTPLPPAIRPQSTVTRDTIHDIAFADCVTITDRFAAVRLYVPFSMNVMIFGFPLRSSGAIVGSGVYVTGDPVGINTLGTRVGAGVIPVVGELVGVAVVGVAVVGVPTGAVVTGAGVFVGVVVVGVFVGVVVVGAPVPVTGLDVTGVPVGVIVVGVVVGEVLVGGLVTGGAVGEGVAIGAEVIGA